MSSCSPSKVAKRLRKKLIQLSLELDDKTKSIELLENATLEEEKANDVLRTDLSQQHSSELEANTLRHKSERSELLEQLNRALAEKEDLAAKVQALLDEKKEEEVKADSAVASIRRTNQLNIEEAKAAWKAGEASRTDAFMSDEKQRITQQTITALEPEVKKIMEAHRSSLSTLKDDEERTRRELATLLQSEYDEKVELHRAELKQQYDRGVQDIQNQWNERSATLHDEHTIAIAQLRDQLFTKKEAQRRDRGEKLKQIMDRHAAELTAARAEKENRLNTLSRENAAERDRFKANAEDELRAISNEVAKRKAEWDKELCAKLESERSKRIADAEAGLSTRRENEIEGLVRKSQVEQLRQEKAIQIGRESREKSLRVEHCNELKRINVDTRRQEDILASTTAEVERLQAQHDVFEKKLSSLRDACNENRSRHSEIEASMTQKTAELHQAMDEIEHKMMEVISRHHERSQVLKERMQMAIEETRADHCRHEIHMGAMKKEHDEVLDKMDAKARRDMADIDRRRTEATREIEDGTTRIEYLQTMLLRYSEENEDEKDQRTAKEDTCGDSAKKKGGRGRIRKALKSIRTTKS